MQAALTATATTADGSSLLALAYHNHVLLYNTTASTRISLTPPPSNAPLASSSASSPPASTAPADDDADDDQPASGAEDDAGDDDSKAETQRPQAQSKAESQPAGSDAKAAKPLSVHDVMHAQNTLTAFRALLFSADGQRLAIADDNKRVTLYDTATGAQLQSIELPKRIGTACFIPRTRGSQSTRYELMVADKAGDIHRVLFPSNPTSAASSAVTLSHLAIITSLSYSPPAADLPALLFSSDSDGHVRLSRHPAHYDIHSFLLSAAGVVCTAVVPDRRLCFSGGLGGELTVWEYGEAGASKVLQRVTVAADAGGEQVQFIGQLVYDARTSLLFVIPYPSSHIHVFSLSTTPSSHTPLTALPHPIALPSGQPAALSVDATGRLYVLSDAAVLWVYGRAEDGGWRVGGGMEQEGLRGLVGAWTDAGGREQGGDEAKEESSASTSVPVWSIGMTVYARWQEKLRRERQMNERQAQLAEKRAAKKRRQ